MSMMPTECYCKDAPRPPCFVCWQAKKAPSWLEQKEAELAAKDAEIEKLKEELWATKKVRDEWRSDVMRYSETAELCSREKGAALEHLGTKDAEIARLNALLDRAAEALLPFASVGESRQLKHEDDSIWNFSFSGAQFAIARDAARAIRAARDGGREINNG